MAFTIIGVPIDSVGLGRAEPHGTELAPAALRAAGLDGSAGPMPATWTSGSRTTSAIPRRASSGSTASWPRPTASARRSPTHRRRRATARARRLLHAAAGRPGRRPRRRRALGPGVRRRSPGPLRRRDVADRRGRRHADRRRARRRARAVGRACGPVPVVDPSGDRDPRLSRCGRTRRCRRTSCRLVAPPGSSTSRPSGSAATAPGRPARPPSSMSSGSTEGRVAAHRSRCPRPGRLRRPPTT